MLWMPGDAGACWLPSWRLLHNPIKITHFPLQVGQHAVLVMLLVDSASNSKGPGGVVTALPEPSAANPAACATTVQPLYALAPAYPLPPYHCHNMLLQVDRANMSFLPGVKREFSMAARVSQGLNALGGGGGAGPAAGAGTVPGSRRFFETFSCFHPAKDVVSYCHGLACARMGCGCLAGVFLHLRCYQACTLCTSAQPSGLACASSMASVSGPPEPALHAQAATPQVPEIELVHNASQVYQEALAPGHKRWVGSQGLHAAFLPSCTMGCRLAITATKISNIQGKHFLLPCVHLQTAVPSLHLCMCRPYLLFFAGTVQHNDPGYSGGARQAFNAYLRARAAE